jgi:acetate kinase
MPERSGVLTINGGSSSLKFALYESADPPVRRLSGRIERIGSAEARMVVSADGGGQEARAVDAPDQGAAANLVLEWLDRSIASSVLAAVGHRIVHGGDRHVEPERVTPGLIEDLHKISVYDPDHLPGEIALIEAFGRAHPEAPQFACFDTAFHHDMPRVARIVPVPRRYEADGVRRYGFHGLSYAYLMEELARTAGAEEARGRVVLAHLGSGASLAAVRDGRCQDTTMGFTPASGLVMATRAGDLDAGLVRFFLEAKGMTVKQFDHVVNHESGLLGVSETSSDMRDLLRREADDPRAAEAVALFCYEARKRIGGLAAALGGLDALVFAGGVGENSPEARARICEGLGFLGLALDANQNAANAPVISTASSRVNVRVIRTDEEVMTARTVFRLLGNSSALSEKME